jgi:hypothetical protein
MGSWSDSPHAEILKDGLDDLLILDGTDDPHGALTFSSADSSNSDRSVDRPRRFSESAVPRFFGVLLEECRIR